MTGDGRWAMSDGQRPIYADAKPIMAKQRAAALHIQRASLNMLAFLTGIFSSAFIWRRRQQGAFISCSTAELLSAHSGCNTRLSKSAARKPASFGRFRQGSAETLVNKAFAGM